MTASNEITIKGTIKAIRKDYTRFSKPYVSIRVEGPTCSMWIKAFTKAQVTRALSSKVGDIITATGTGRHTGSSIYAKGATSLTVRTMRIRKNEPARTTYAREPQQLELV